MGKFVYVKKNSTFALSIEKLTIKGKINYE